MSESRKYRDIPASEWTPDKWPLPTPEQMDLLRRLLPPVTSNPAASEAA